MHAPHLALYYDAAWLALAIVWLAGAFMTKPAERNQTRTSRLGHTLVFLVAALLLANTRIPLGPLSRRFVPRSLLLGYVGLALTIGGIAFAIWARFYLGGNWSARVTVKKDHELVRSGPYSTLRHPIYTGVLTALAGTALAIGQIHALLGLAIAVVGLVLKFRLEEKFMTEQFGEQYAIYQREVKSLVPFVW